MTSRRATIRSTFAYALTAALLMLAALAPNTALSAPATTPTVTDPRYFAGVNVPWFNWGCDFGCGSDHGVSAPAVRSALSDGFSQLKTAGVHTVRWWTFEGDPSQITRDASGAPSGLNPAVYADFDAALALADQYDLVYDFVLFSAPTAVPAAWTTDPDQRQKLANTLAPLFERYKNHPRILAWEFFNEPEYDIWGNKVPAAAVQATVKLLASTVHAHTTTAVTVGSATLDSIPLWVGSGLDFYSPHWYDNMNSGLQCARCTDAAAARATPGFDGLPIVLGEFYAGPDTDALQRFKDFRAKGYAGAWAWSLFTDKTSDGKRVDLAAVAKFTSDQSLAATATPVPALAANAPSGLVQLKANWLSPTYAMPGNAVTFYQDVMSSRDTNILVDFEIFDSQGRQVSQIALDNQPVSANALTSFSTKFTLPLTLAAGTYTVKTGAFSPDGGTLYAWSDLAGTFVVEALPPTPTPIPAAPDASDDQ